MLLPLLFLVAVVSSSPTVDHSVACALCQFGSHFLVDHHQNGTMYNGLPISQAKEQCHQLKGCTEKLTDCELIQAVSAIIPHDDDQYRAFSFAIRLISLQCAIAPETEVMNEFQLQSILTCPICTLIYNIFSQINTGLQTNQIINKDIPLLVTDICDVVSLFLGGPALCYPLLDPEVKAPQALMRGILDSLGSFYDEIGKPFGCPIWQDLFTICPPKSLD